MNMLHSTKNLYIINGTMGVGKTTVCQELLKELENCVFLDGDWCWMMDPFIVNDETKSIVLDNISYCINNYLHSSLYKNIILCWVIPTQAVLDDLLNHLDIRHNHVYSITLMCNKETLIKRLDRDIQNGKREDAVINKAIQYLDNYSNMDTIKIDTTNFTIKEIVKKINELVDSY